MLRDFGLSLGIFLQFISRREIRRSIAKSLVVSCRITVTSNRLPSGSFAFRRKLSDDGECNPCNYSPENENAIEHLLGFALAPTGWSRKMAWLSLTAIGHSYTSMLTCVCTCEHVCVYREGERLREGSSNDDRQGCSRRTFPTHFLRRYLPSPFVLVNVNGP